MFRFFTLGRLVLSLFLAGSVYANLTADVVFLQDGGVLIGAYLGSTPEGVEYQIFAQKRTLAVDSIRNSQKDLNSLSALNLSLLLKDGSVIRGKVADYDEEIGLFMDIGFGILTIPVEAIAELYDPITRKRYSGGGTDIQLGGGIYFPFGYVASSFGPSWQGTVSFSSALEAVRGLRLGGGLTLKGMDYLPSATADYFMASIWPEIRYQLLGWRMRDDLLRGITPSVALHGGVSYIVMSDTTLLPQREATLTGFAGLELAVDIELIPELYLRVGGTCDWVIQKSQQFLNAGATLSVGFNL